MYQFDQCYSKLGIHAKTNPLAIRNVIHNIEKTKQRSHTKNPQCHNWTCLGLVKRRPFLGYHCMSFPLRTGPHHGSAGIPQHAVCVTVWPLSVADHVCSPHHPLPQPVPPDDGLFTLIDTNWGSLHRGPNETRITVYHDMYRAGPTPSRWRALTSTWETYLQEYTVHGPGGFYLVVFLLLGFLVYNAIAVEYNWL